MRSRFRLGFYTIAGAEGIHLKKEEITVASLLKKQGYDTCFVGKWHLRNLEGAQSSGSGPGKVEAVSLSAEFVNGTDWLPTICAATGAPIPYDRTMDGLVGMFPAGYDDDYLPGMAMRDGKEVLAGWFSPKRPEQGNSEWVKSTRPDRFKLYDLSIDRPQTSNLATKRPEDFTRLRQRMTALWTHLQSEAPALVPEIASPSSVHRV